MHCAYRPVPVPYRYRDELGMLVRIALNLYVSYSIICTNFRVIATAITYLRRVYTRVVDILKSAICLLSVCRKSMTEYDPRLVAPTCLYLASKVEESTVQARLLVFYIKKMYAGASSSDEKYRFEIKDILEMEMKVLEALDYYLVVFHPYRPLLQ
ncbi:hypothetical protein GW17_00027996 [Ensete ventricosum]|nr:hypothetical protein GW17_00027996 [Ensete ventricosum]